MLSKIAKFSLTNAQRTSQVMAVQPQRFYMKDLGMDSASLMQMETDKQSAGEVSMWKEQVEHTKNALVLKTNDEIEKYVLSIVREYFRTTKKASVTLDCNLSDHGLDSLDAIELVIRIEDELGYIIDGENLEKFKKPKHFFNFIKHMEAYKEEFNQLPQDNTKATFDFYEAFPGFPKMKWSLSFVFPSYI